MHLTLQGSRHSTVPRHAPMCPTCLSVSSSVVPRCHVTRGIIHSGDSLSTHGTCTHSDTRITTPARCTAVSFQSCGAQRTWPSPSFVVSLPSVTSRLRGPRAVCLPLCLHVTRFFQRVLGSLPTPLVSALRDAGLDDPGVLSEYLRDAVKELETRLGVPVAATSAGQSSSSSCNSSFTPLLDSMIISGSSRMASLGGGLVGDTNTGGDPRTDHATCFPGGDPKTDHASFSTPGGDPRTDHEASESASFVVGECDESVGMAVSCPFYWPGRLATETACSIPSALASDCFSAADVSDARPVLCDGFSAISASPVLRDGFPTTSEHPDGFTHEKNPTFFTVV